MRIDAHHHLWRYDPAEYPWIDGSLAALQRDFLPSDLADEMHSAGVDAAIAVQARCSLDETRWLLQQAAQQASICAVVGWAPLASDRLPAVLDELSGETKLVGFREILQDEPAGSLDREAIHRGISLLAAREYTYDLLIRARQIEEATRFVDRHPRQQFVLDHAAKPRIAESALEPWRSSVRDLARRDNVVCKLSGLVTEADWNAWTPEMLRPYLDTCVEAFGPDRLLAGSDWPVCLVATTYSRWWHVLEEYFAPFSPAEREATFGGNAQRVYRCFLTPKSREGKP